MKFETSNFGVIEVEKENVIHFEEGLPGFVGEKQFTIILNEDNPISFLQSLRTPDLSFAIVNPFQIYKDYDFILSDQVQASLKIEDPEDLVVYSLVTIPDDMRQMTTNLMAPLIINTKNKLAKQVILDENKYTTKHYILGEEVREGRVEE